MKKIIFGVIILITVFSVYAQVPNSPILVLPPEEASVVSLTPTLEWESVSGADCYFIFITSDSNTTPPPEFCMTATNSYTVPAGTLVANATYYWRVQAHNSSGWGDPSPFFSFTTLCATVQGSINNLINQVNDIVTAGNLTFYQSYFLNNRLESAINQVNLDHDFVAIISMTLFKFRVHMLDYANMLPDKEAASLQYSADGVIDLIQTISSKPGNINHIELPKEFRLVQNYPNPFNPVTTIEYSIPENSIVTLKVYDLLGSEVTTLVDKYQTQGSYIINWNASGYSSGVYIYRLTAGNRTESKKMILSK